jgi:hypothetical protein
MTLRDKEGGKLLVDPFLFAKFSMNPFGGLSDENREQVPSPPPLRTDNSLTPSFTTDHQIFDIFTIKEG